MSTERGGEREMGHIILRSRMFRSLSREKNLASFLHRPHPSPDDAAGTGGTKPNRRTKEKKGEGIYYACLRTSYNTSHKPKPAVQKQDKKGYNSTTKTHRGAYTVVGGLPLTALSRYCSGVIFRRTPPLSLIPSAGSPAASSGVSSRQNVLPGHVS